MMNEEVHVKVNAVHRLKTVILSIGPEEAVAQLVPYIDTLIKDEDDEVLFAIAEELGKCFNLITDLTMFLPLLENLAKKDETVVRDQASDSLNIIVKYLSDAEI
jgi:serine/threonine-protein phosphatase 2A regulatory subunit A